MRMTRHQTSDSSCNVASYSFVSVIHINIPEVLRSVRLRHVIVAPVLALNTIPIHFTSAYNTSSLCTGTPICPFFFTYMIHRATRTILESFGCFTVLRSCCCNSCFSTLCFGEWPVSFVTSATFSVFLQVDDILGTWKLATLFAHGCCGVTTALTGAVVSLVFANSKKIFKILIMHFRRNVSWWLAALQKCSRSE
jgi:hypothetical protein